jgi:hypothetical protein
MYSQRQHYAGTIRQAQKLPLNLNTFKYLGKDDISGGLLFSEWVELSQNTISNKIIFKVGSTKPIVMRIQVEDE